MSKSDFQQEEIDQLTNETLNLKQQISQLERKKSSIALVKYTDLQDGLEKFRAENIRLTSQVAELKQIIIEQSKKTVGSDGEELPKYKAEIATLNKKITDMHRRHTSEIKRLEAQLADKPKSGRSRKSDISDDEVKQMSKQGKSLRTISRETGLSVNTIRNVLK